jgi:hypothetical protein
MEARGAHQSQKQGARRPWGNWLCFVILLNLPGWPPPYSDHRGAQNDLPGTSRALTDIKNNSHGAYRSRASHGGAAETDRDFTSSRRDALLGFVRFCVMPAAETRIGVGRTDLRRSPLPPNRASGSPAHGSPVGGFTFARTDILWRGLRQESTARARQSKHSASADGPYPARVRFRLADFAGCFVRALRRALLRDPLRQAVHHGLRQISTKPNHLPPFTPCSRAVSMRSVHTDASTQGQRPRISPACLAPRGTAAGWSCVELSVTPPPSYVPSLQTRYGPSSLLRTL